MQTVVGSCLTALILMLVSCGQIRKQPDIEGTLANLTQRFQQLPKAKGHWSEFYHQIRSVTIGDKGIKLQLRSSPDTVKSPQSIILVINSKNDVYGVPLFSNAYKDYWNFLSDTLLTSVKPTSTTFQRELQICIDTLDLNDILGTAGKVINEILLSLLQCRLVYDSDSSELQSLRSFSNHDLPEEETDDCQARFQKNWIAIYKEMHPAEYRMVRNSFWDERNARVYQFEHSTKKKEKLKVVVRTYRQDCVFHILNL